MPSRPVLYPKSQRCWPRLLLEHGRASRTRCKAADPPKPYRVSPLNLNSADTDQVSDPSPVEMLG